MKFLDIDQLAKEFAPVIRAFVEKASTTLRKDFTKSLDDGLQAVRADVGADIELQADNLGAAVDALTEKVANIPAPADTGPSADEIQANAVKLIDAAVQKAVEGLTLPKDGRDALEIDLLPAIDAEKVYSRGTWASHNGGIWRAHSTTTGMRGWECVVDGWGQHSIEQIDARNFKVIFEKSSGATTEQTLTLPTMVYKGVYKAGNQYQKGDVATFGGSLWHCNEDTETKPGDGSKAWQLCAKKGRDGVKAS